MSRRIGLILLLLLGGFVLISLSCGKDKDREGPTGPSETSTTPAVLAVPDNAQYRPDDLTVITSDGDKNASASGEFDAPTSETSRLAIAETPDGDAYMLALWNPEAPIQRVDVTTTAVTLVFYASYLFTAPTDLYDEVQDLIEATPEVSQLARTLEEQLRTNSLATAASSATVQSALRAAVEAVEAQLSAMSGVGKVVPTGPRSQVRVIHPDGNEAQIEVRNAGRRYISVYVDQTAPTSKNIVENTLQGPASEALSVSTLVHWIRRNRGEGEILSPSTQTFDLPITEHARNLFAVEIVGPAFKSYSGGSEYASGYWKAWAFTALDFMVLKVLSTVVGLELDGEALFYASQTQEVIELIDFVVSELRSGQGLGKALSEGDLEGMLDGAFSMLTTKHARKLIVDAASRALAKQIGIAQLGKMIAQIDPVIKSIKIGCALVDLGTVSYTLIVADDVETFAVEVGEPPNQPPTAHAGSDQTVTVGTDVTLDGSGSSDPDGDPLTYQWTQTAGPTAALSGATTATPTFTPIEAGTYVFSLVVNDGQVDSEADEVTVTANADTELKWTENPSNGHWYALTSPVTWEEAQRIAASHGGYLVSIGDEEEEKWLDRTFNDALPIRFGDIWIGLTDRAQEGTWTWLNGEPVNYLHWYPGEPRSGGESNDAVTMNYMRETSGSLPSGWNDCPGNNSWPAIVERDTRP